MSTPSRKGYWICPECGAYLDSKERSCWLCRWEPRRKQMEATTPTARPVKAVLVEGPPPQRPWAFQFTSSTMLLTITAVAILLGLFFLAPGLGIVSAILLAPPLLRTFWIAGRSRAQGEPLSPSEKAESFSQSLAATFVALVIGGIASATAFFTICLAGMAGSPRAEPLLKNLVFSSLVVGFVVGGIVFFLAAYWIRQNTS